MSTLRFAYITDTHLGCDATGYQLQPRYLGREQALFDGLAGWLEEHDVAFVVHGGDLTDHGTPQEIDAAGDLCARLGVPVYLCLGNHDLAQPGSMDHWRSVRGGLLPGGRDCFAVDAGPAVLVVAGHHWHPHVDFHWQAGEPQAPRLSPEQLATLDTLLRGAGRPVIAVTHAPLNDVPVEQRGTEEPFHPPHAPYLADWRRLADRHANLRLALCGHTHAHSRHDHGRFVSCTTAALGEAPAQARLITVRPDAIEVESVSLAGRLGLTEALHPPHAWCVGTAAEHRFSIAL